jgi:hypothetical protein
MAGRRERCKGGRDDTATRRTGAVAPVFVSRRIGHNSVEAASIAAARTVASIGPELVGKSGYGASPL